MKSSTLECLAPLLALLRSYPELREVRPTSFQLHGKDFIHFHEAEDGGVFADARLAKGQIRMPVSTPEQQELLERIEETLGALEAQSRKRQGRKRNRRDGERKEE